MASRLYTVFTFVVITAVSLIFLSVSVSELRTVFLLASPPPAGATSTERPTSRLKTGTTSKESLSFTNAMRKFKWDDLINSANDPHENARVVSDYIETVSVFAMKEPLVEINQDTCKSPPPLPDPSLIDCRKYPNASFTGLRREKPVRVVHMVLFGFDVDVLEIHLRELYDVVDYFFILESTRTQLNGVRKPLIWEAVRLQERFAIFREKVVHLILDDVVSSLTSSEKENIFALQDTQERMLAEEFLNWNSKQSDPLNSDDLIGFGDTDEVTDRLNVHLLKHCQIQADSIDIGIWFPMGRLENAFRTDWPVPGYSYSLGDPSYMTLKKVQNILASGRIPTRARGRSGHFLLGGMHMTRHQFVPFMMLNYASCGECGGLKDHQFLNNLKQVMISGDFPTIEKFWIDINMSPFKSRIIPRDQLPHEQTAIVHVPWFLACQPERYPYWSGKHDSRLDLDYGEGT